VTPTLRRAGLKAFLANVTSTTAAAAQVQQTSPVMTVIDGRRP
jgi:hypothetical protein